MADLDYARVTGRFSRIVGDTAVDTDDDPDVVYCNAGRVIITPLVTEVKVIGGTEGPFTASGAPIECTIGTDGRLTYGDKPFVKVLDLTSDKVNPVIGPDLATHRVSFVEVMAGNGADQVRVEFADRVVRLTAAGPDGDGVNDLTLVAPVVAGTPTPIYRGPAGPDGGPGPEGDVTPEALAAQAGAEAAQDGAETARDAAAGSATSASTSATAASTARDGAVTARTGAESARDAAAGSATNAAGSANSASQDAASIAGSVSAAQDAAATATGAATTATTKAGEAAASATTATQQADRAEAAADQATAGGVRTVNGKSPDANGAVAVTAADVGAATPSDVSTASTADRARGNHTGTQPADTVTETSTIKLLTADERTKLAGVATGATANATDAQLRDRTTHTGEQAISTVTNLQNTLNSKSAKSANLSDLASASAARTNLGLGDAAVATLGTAAGQVPVLNANGRLDIARLASGAPDGTKFVRDDGTLAVPAGGGGSGMLVAPVVYRPTPAVALVTTSGTPVDVDATNLAITVTLPTNGKAMIQCEALLESTSANVSIFLCLREGSANVAGTGTRAVRASNSATAQDRPTVSFQVSGTPGTVHTYKLGWAVNGQSFLRAGAPASEFSSLNDLYGPAVLTAWSVP